MSDHMIAVRAVQGYIVKCRRIEDEYSPRRAFESDEKYRGAYLLTVDGARRLTEQLTKHIEYIDALKASLKTYDVTLDIRGKVLVRGIKAHDEDEAFELAQVEYDNRDIEADAEELDEAEVTDEGEVLDAPDPNESEDSEFKEVIPPTREEKLLMAARVISLDPIISDWLKTNSRKAYEQLESALWNYGGAKWGKAQKDE